MFRQLPGVGPRDLQWTRYAFGLFFDPTREGFPTGFAQRLRVKDTGLLESYIHTLYGVTL